MSKRTPKVDDGKVNAVKSETKRSNAAVERESRGTSRRTGEAFRNDPMWYGINAAMFESAGNISFNNALGAAYELEWDDNSFVADKRSMPGIIGLYLNPSCGVAVDTTSDINVAARQLYSNLRSKNAGSSTYDPVDYMLYYLAMGEVYSLYSFMVRAYGVMRVYSQTNRYVPDALFTTMGLDFADFQKRQADFYWYITQYASKLNRFAIPAGLPYLNRKMYVYSGMYVDDNSPKHQFYLYVPAGFWKYVETEGAGRLQWVEFVNPNSPGVLTYDQFVAYADDLMLALVQSQDIATNMSGDTLKAYGDNIVRAAIPAVDYVSIPVYDQYSLLQIHNTTVFNYGEFITDSFNVEQNPNINGYLIHQPKLRSEGQENLWKAYGGRRILDMMQYSGTPADVMEATRDMVITKDYDPETDFTLPFDTCGADYCVGMCYGAFKDVNDEWKYTLNTSLGHIRAVSDSSTDLAQTLGLLADLTKFDWHPQVSLCIDDSGDLKYVGTFGDVGNFTTIGKYELRKLNTTAMLSLFSIPPTKV